VEASYDSQGLLKLAIAIESAGRKLYERFERETKDDDLRQTWALLKSQEVEHAVTFQRLLRVAELSQPAADSSAGPSPYLRAVAASCVLMESRLARTLADSIHSDVEALELAIAVERDTIFTYISLKDQLIGDHSRVFEQIVAEEKRHLIRLSELRDALPDRLPAPPPDFPTGL
jgi:rubrerythrin